MKKIIIFIQLFTLSVFLHAQTKTIHNGKAGTITLVKKSPPVKSLPSAVMNPSGERVVRENESLEHKTERVLNPNSKPTGNDPALQKMYGAGETSVNILSNWLGLDAEVDPSDNTIAVSADYVVQMTNNWNNSVMNVWNKAGDLLADGVNSGDITDLEDWGDCDLLYDEQADRFLFVVLDGFGSKLIVAISETGDPTGSWYAYRFNTPDGYPDYPKIGVWGNSYLLTTNSNNPTLWAINRDSLLVGAPIGTVQQFIIDEFGTISFESASPVSQIGATPPPAGAPAMFIRVGDDAWMGEDVDHLEMFFVDVNWADADLSTITGPVDLLTIPYDSKLCGFDSWSCIPQPGTATKLDPLSDIVMDKVQYRNFGDKETIVCSHVCRAYTGGESGIRWYELRKDTADWNIHQQGTFAPNDSNYRFMSSMTINEFGTMALGYNISSSTVDPGIRITGRVPCDTLNTMGAPEVVAQEGTHFNSYNRYGDYNGLVTDPADGSFWLTANYNPSAGWKTRVIHFSIDSCTAESTVADTTEVIDTTTDTVTTFIPELLFSDLFIVPNPADELLELTFTSTDVQDIYLQMFDITGKIVLEKNIISSVGVNTIKLQVDDIEDGTYILNMRSETSTVMRKVVVMHE